MTKTLFLAAVAAGLLASAPTMAQPQIQFGIGPDGRPQIGVGDPAEERRERWRQQRAYEAGRRDAMREDRYDVYETRCRNITIQEEDRRGRTITRRIRRCD